MLCPFAALRRPRPRHGFRRCATFSVCRLLVAVLALLAMPWPLLALDPALTITQYSTRTWRRSNGLPSNAVTAIVQASSGHIVLGTARGLVDFDGIEFHAFGLPGQPESRPRLIASLARRRAGGLWLGIERGGYGYFDQERFTVLHRDNFGGDLPTARAVLEAQDGSLYLAVAGIFGRQRPPGAPVHLATDLDVMCLHEDARGRIWLGTANRGLFYWEGDELHEVTGAAAALWHGAVISAIAVDSAGVVWVGASNGLHSLNPDLSPRPSIGFPGQAQALLFDSHGVLWAGTIANGLFRIHEGKFRSIGRAEGLASDRVLSLAESADGSLWVGTEDGLTQLVDVKFPVLSTAEGLAAEACLAVAAGADGALWAGTANGLTRIAAGDFRSYGVNRRDGFFSEWIKRLFVARNGDVYFLGGRQDFSRFRHGVIDKTWHTGSWPQALCEDDRSIIVSIRTGLRRVENDELLPYLLADGSEPALGWITELLRARDGSLWIAAKPGLAQVRNGVLRDFSRELASTDAGFFYLCETDDGAIWAARNSGLVRVKDGQLATVDHTQGLHSDVVYAMVPDLRGNLWMDSPEGIFRVSQRDLAAVADGTAARLTCEVFDGSHALKTSDKTTREFSGARTPDGCIWFPSSNGLIRIDPDRIPVDRRPPPVYLERIVVDGRAIPTDRTPELAPGFGNLEFNYTALDFRAPERIRYRYRLEGYDDRWVDAGSRRAAFFTNLDPGRYRFQVQASNADGVWNTAGAGFAFTLPRPFHATFWFRAVLVTSALGLVGSIAFFVERRRRAELAEVRRREELQLRMIESSPVAMAMLDRQHRILYTNATFTRIFGYSAAELPDMDTWWRRTCPVPADRDEWARTWARRVENAAALGRSIEPIETTILARDGQQRTLAVTTSAVGERTLVVCADLTEHKRAEDERRRLEEQLRQGQKMEAIGRLSGGVAHDFNNLLTVILGNVSLIETLERLPRELADSLTEIKEAASRAANLTRQLLAFSRKQPLRPTRLDLNQVVTDMTRMLRRIMGEDIQLEARLDPQPMEVHADHAMIEQVVLNLAVNARDAMPRGGRLTLATALIELAPEQVPPVTGAGPGRFVRLTVADTGSGIAPEVLPRIFEPFFTTKDVGKGTGLGLATVYGVIEQHRGWVAVSSEVARGTRFEVHLPACTTAAPAAAPNPVSRPPSPPASRRLVLLVVEDDTSVRTLARRALSARGHRVLEAGSGPTALEVWAHHHAEIEVLLTDLVMPDGMNGLELARRLRAERPELRVVYTSGYSAEVAGGAFAGREGVDFIAKPYDPARLVEIVENATPDTPVP